MYKEINYPIKYAVLELKERGGYSVGYEDITQGFIVSKCYVIESNIVYNYDGSNKIIHKVVFPFSNIEKFKNALRNGRHNIGDAEVPKYDACNRIYPINEVTDLFDSYDDAKEAAIEKNEDYEYNIMSKTRVPLGGYMMGENNLHRILINNFKRTLEICNLFEQLALQETENMSITEQLVTDNKKSFVKVLKP